MKILTIVLCLLTVSCASLQNQDPWTKEQKILQAASITLRVADWGTTLDIVDKPEEYKEANPILGEHPSRSEVNNFFISAIALTTLISHYLPTECRSKFLKFNVIVSAVCVANNYGVGLRMNF